MVLLVKDHKRNGSSQLIANSTAEKPLIINVVGVELSFPWQLTWYRYHQLFPEVDPFAYQKVRWNLAREAQYFTEFFFCYLSTVNPNLCPWTFCNLSFIQWILVHVIPPVYFTDYPWVRTVGWPQWEVSLHLYIHIPHSLTTVHTYTLYFNCI